MLNDNTYGKWTELLLPIWKSQRQYRETFTMIEEDGICKAPFLFQPNHILCVESYDKTCTYEQGIDYYVKDNQLYVTADSRIPSTTWDTFYYPKDTDKMEQLLQELSVLNWPIIKTTDDRYLNPSAVSHPEYLTKWQVTVTYTTNESWEGYTPLPSLKNLPHLNTKIKNHENIKILLFGDSISFGCDCSGLYHQEPEQPVWIQMVCDSLENRYGIDVKCYNTSESGRDSDWAIDQIEERVCKYNPDLVILGYGMNDRCHGDEFLAKTKKLRDSIQSKLPEAEFILIATSIPNPLLATPPYYFSAHQNEFPDALRTLCKEGTVLADVWNVQENIMKKKRYIDIAGNNINHPNDYLARIYAQIFDTILQE